jgi:hypothetical protein
VLLVASPANSMEFFICPVAHGIDTKLKAITLVPLDDLQMGFENVFSDLVLLLGGIALAILRHKALKLLLLPIHVSYAEHALYIGA